MGPEAEGQCVGECADAQLMFCHNMPDVTTHHLDDEDQSVCGDMLVTFPCY